MPADINKTMNINITCWSIIKTIAILVLIYLLYLIKDILVVFFVALILSSALNPWVDWLHKRRIPRSIGILFIYFILFIFVSLIIYLIIPPMAKEIGDLSANFPDYIDKINSFLKNFSSHYAIKFNLLENLKNNLSNIGSNLEAAVASIFSALTSIFGGLVSFILVLVLAFYMVVEENAMKKLIWSLAPEKNQAYIMNLVDRMQKKIGLWLRGQLILMFFIFILSYFGLLILGVKYALVLALIAGLMEFVPYLGPILGAIPAVFLAFTQSPMLALFVAGLYYIIQLVENNILVPKIMQKAVGLHPLISMFALLIGFQLGGIIGAILSMPIATAASVLVNDIFFNKETVKK